MLTLTIYYEAGNQPTACKAMVADTVINRMAQRKLTAEQVIRQKNQFEWIPVLLKQEKPYKCYVKLIRDKNPMTKQAIGESARFDKLNSFINQPLSKFIEKDGSILGLWVMLCI